MCNKLMVCQTFFYFLTSFEKYGNHLLDLTYPNVLYIILYCPMSKQRWIPLYLTRLFDEISVVCASLNKY